MNQGYAGASRMGGHYFLYGEKACAKNKGKMKAISDLY